jgi:GNAT superfamily N-acetyltransferase
MQIRPFEDADELAVIDLWNEVLPDAAPHNDPATMIHRKLAVERELFFVALSDGAVVGTVMGGYDGHRGWVYAVAVRPTFRRRGIGAALIRRLETALAARLPQGQLAGARVERSGGRLLPAAGLLGRGAGQYGQKALLRPNVGASHERRGESQLCEGFRRSERSENRHVEDMSHPFYLYATQATVPQWFAAMNAW